VDSRPDAIATDRDNSKSMRTEVGRGAAYMTGVIRKVAATLKLKRNNEMPPKPDGHHADI
jgi:hypothetical protein